MALSTSRVLLTIFAMYFSKVCTSFSDNRYIELYNEYEDMRNKYTGFTEIQFKDIDVELVDSVIRNMKGSKVTGLDRPTLTVDHMLYSHPIIIVIILSRLFNLLVRFGYVHNEFGSSYIVPIRKCNCSRQSLTINDFRGIAISSVLSKVLQHCLLSKYSEFLQSSNSQFDF